MVNNMIAFYIGFFLTMLTIGCGGVQGPQGPPGPAASSGMNRMYFAQTLDPAKHYVSTVGANPVPIWTFDLAEVEAELPESASALYVEINGCRNFPTNQAGLIRFRTLLSDEVYILSSERCDSAFSMAITAKRIWLPSASPHQVIVEALDSVSHGSTAAMAWVTVLGWYEP